MRDFDAALERVVAGMQSRKTLTDHEKRVVAYHEAGHALCGELLPSVDRVHRISIVPRGRALGYTLNLPEEDRYLKTREELIDFMTMLLGGRAAEQLVFGSITTGASDDLKRVAEIARAMVHEYAMGTGSGSLRAIDDGAAEATRRVRDAEVRELADEAYRAAQQLVDAHRVTSTSSPPPCWPTRCSSARTSTGSWATCRAPPRARIGRAVGGRRHRGQPGAPHPRGRK